MKKWKSARGFKNNIHFGSPYPVQKHYFARVVFFYALKHLCLTICYLAEDLHIFDVLIHLKL